MIASTEATKNHGLNRPALCGLLFVLMPFCPAVLAQTDLSTIRGTATDQTGAVIPAVTITLLNSETNAARTLETDEAGNFEIPLVGPGIYRLTAEAAGFQNFIADNIVITSRETRRIDAPMQLGTVGTEITVTAGAALITTEGSKISGNFNTDKFVDSPLSYSFFPQAHMTTQPGVQTPAGGWSIRIGGQNTSQAQEQMDGIANDGVVNLVQNMNDFEELQVITSNQSAEYARAVGFGMTGKSGTNQFHGRFYYDHINSALNARDFFEQTKTPFKQHRGGFNVSGPVFKDKTFFFFGYSVIRIPAGSFFNRNVAPTAFRTGDFSSEPTPVMDPASSLTA